MRSVKPNITLIKRITMIVHGRKELVSDSLFLCATGWMYSGWKNIKIVLFSEPYSLTWQQFPPLYGEGRCGRNNNPQF